PGGGCARGLVVVSVAGEGPRRPPGGAWVRFAALLWVFALLPGGGCARGLLVVSVAGEGPRRPPGGAWVRFAALPWVLGVPGVAVGGRFGGVSGSRRNAAIS